MQEKLLFYQEWLCWLWTAWNFPILETSQWMPKTTALHSYLNLEMFQVPLVKRTPLRLQRVLLRPGHIARGSSHFHCLQSPVLTWGLIFRQIGKKIQANFCFSSTNRLLHWKGSFKPPGPRLQAPAQAWVKEAELCLSLWETWILHLVHQHDQCGDCQGGMAA